MMKLKFAIISVVLLTGCSAEERVYHTGPRGGCYYVTSSGERQYVDRSMCQERQTKTAEVDEGNLEIFRQMFIKEFQTVPGCRLLTLEGEFRAGNYSYEGSAFCDGKEDSVRAVVYNATSASGKGVKVMEEQSYPHHLKSKIFIDPENHSIIERIPRR